MSKGWMSTSNGLFRPGDSVFAGDAATALTTLGINISSLSSLPRYPGTVLTKGQFLQILAEAFHPQLQQILKTKSQAEYTRVWNAIPSSMSHANAVRMAILAGWIQMPQGTFHGTDAITRAEVAKILVNAVGK
jgi:hypothetical protein